MYTLFPNNCGLLMVHFRLSAHTKSHLNFKKLCKLGYRHSLDGWVMFNISWAGHIKKV